MSRGREGQGAGACARAGAGTGALARAGTGRSGTHLETLRQTSLAGHLRSALYRHLVGGEWPLVFRAPEGEVAEEGAEAIYVHVPFCRALCGHCPYLKVPWDPERVRRYGLALEAELAAWMERTPHRPLRHVYFGGGSPGMAPDLAQRCLARLAPRIDEGTAIGMELHPLDVDGPRLARLQGMGIRRVSLGVETLSDGDLLRLGRGYTASRALEALEVAAGSGFECLDVNLLYGLSTGPDQVVEDARACVARGAHQVSAYPLMSFRHTRPPWIPHLRSLLARDRTQRRLREACTALGLEASSVWSWTRPGVEPYSTVTLEAFRGFGAGAATRREGAFWFHTFDVEAYSAPGGARPALILQGGPRFDRAHWIYWKIYALRVPGEAYRQCFGRLPEEDFPALFQGLRCLGFLSREGADWRVTPRGALWVHRLQQLYSLSWIDQFWLACLSESWPTEVRLT